MFSVRKRAVVSSNECVCNLCSWDVSCLSHEQPLPFRSIHYLFVICSRSVRIPFNICLCAFSICFESVLYPFYIRDQLLHVAFYDFHSFLKSAHAGQQFVCGSLTASIQIFLVVASHASLEHTLCFRSFRLCRSTVHQVVSSAIQLCMYVYIHTYRLHEQVERC